MSDPALKLLEKFGTSRGPTAAKSQPVEFEERKCWGFVTGNRRAFNIELRRLVGTWPAFEYTWLPKPVWCPAETTIEGVKIPSASIVLRYTTGDLVAIIGRNLRDCYKKLLEHQVTYFSELDEASQLLEREDSVIVTRIHVVEPKPESR